MKRRKLSAWNGIATDYFEAGKKILQMIKTNLYLVKMENKYTVELQSRNTNPTLYKKDNKTLITIRISY